MQQRLAEIRNSLPSVYLTLLSMLQAIALESLVSRVSYTRMLWIGSLKKAAHPSM
jgi:hypothetical protein